MKARIKSWMKRRNERKADSRRAGVVARKARTVSDQQKNRLEEIQADIDRNMPILKARAPHADDGLLISASKYRDVLERLAKE